MTINTINCSQMNNKNSLEGQSCETDGHANYTSRKKLRSVSLIIKLSNMTLLALSFVFYKIS